MRAALRGCLIGLTGGIGSGKSAAADGFSRLGGAVVDADAIAHELTQRGGAALPAIERTFGPSALAADGSLDRAAMRRLVFADARHRQRLEAILHPLIRVASDERCVAAWAAGAAYAVMVVPLLVESGLQSSGRFDRIAVVDCPEALQVSRVMARSGLTQPEVEAIMATQASRSARLKAADDVIKNDESMEALNRRIQALHVNYAALAEKIRGNG